jgi:hypothetical protein
VIQLLQLVAVPAGDDSELVVRVSIGRLQEQSGIVAAHCRITVSQTLVFT